MTTFVKSLAEKYLPKTIITLCTAIAVLCTAISALWVQNVGLSGKIEKLNDRILSYEREKSLMSSKFLAFVNSQDSSPLPMWIKAKDGRMLSINKAYERIFLLPHGKRMMEYIDHYDHDIWPEHVAEEFREHDMYVLQFELVLDTVETVPSVDDPKREIRIIKWPVYGPGIEGPFAVAGVAIPKTIR